MARKPLELKRRQGNPGHQKLPKPASTVPLDRIPTTPPRSLHLGPDGRRLWKHVAGLPWVGTSDAPALTLMCQQLDMHAALQAEILEHGLTYETRGRRYVNPAVAAASEVGRQLWSMMAQFGLSPADRSKLGVAEVKAMSMFDELLARRAQRDAPVQNGPSTL